MTIKQRRKRDSSLTRVGPVFDALADETDWIARLLDLAQVDGVDRSLPSGIDLTPAANGSYWQGKRGSEREYALQPPVSLLSWLIRNLEIPRGMRLGAGDVDSKRSALARRDQDVISEALKRLRTGGVGRGWHILEGPSYPDAFIIAKDALFVVEGKRTEASTTTSTTWMPERHQIWRHLDGAWEVRGNRRVFGMLIVEGNEAGNVPAVWSDAARAAMSPSAIAASLPHRSDGERSGIASSFWGVTTWQAVCDEFGLDRGTVLLDVMA